MDVTKKARAVDVVGGWGGRDSIGLRMTVNWYETMKGDGRRREGVDQSGRLWRGGPSVDEKTVGGEDG